VIRPPRLHLTSTRALVRVRSFLRLWWLPLRGSITVRSQRKSLRQETAAEGGAPRGQMRLWASRSPSRAPFVSCLAGVLRHSKGARQVSSLPAVAGVDAGRMEAKPQTAERARTAAFLPRASAAMRRETEALPAPNKRDGRRWPSSRGNGVEDRGGLRRFGRRAGASRGAGSGGVGRGWPSPLPRAMLVSALG
jgi:hypothetical protein